MMNVEKTALLALLIGMVAFATASAVPSLLTIDHIESNSINNAENISTYNLTADDAIYTNKVQPKTGTSVEIPNLINNDGSLWFYLYDDVSWDEANINLQIDDDSANYPQIELYVYDDDSGNSNSLVLDTTQLKLGFGTTKLNSLEVGGLFDQKSNTTFHVKRLEGTGSAYVCVDANGYIYRSTSACV